MSVGPELLAQLAATDNDKPAAKPLPPMASSSAAPAQTMVMQIPQALLNKSAEMEEDSHYRSVFDDFMRVRGECGEVGALGFEKFSRRLEKSKVAVMAKTGCKDVEFSVYVKNGKAALKAGPAKKA